MALVQNMHPSHKASHKFTNEWVPTMIVDVLECGERRTLMHHMKFTHERVLTMIVDGLECGEHRTVCRS